MIKIIDHQFLALHLYYLLNCILFFCLRGDKWHGPKFEKYENGVAQNRICARITPLIVYLIIRNIIDHDANNVI